MCQICSQFTPYLDGCSYEGLGDGGPAIVPIPTVAGIVLNEDSGDAAGNSSTTYTMSVGDYFRGTLSSTTESDWIAITLEAGQTYSFGLTGVGALNAGVDDPYLRLRDASGNLVDENDDIDNPNGVLFSALTYTATTSGTYYLDVQSWSTSAGGDYGVSVTTGSRPSFDAYMGAGMLLRPDASWAATPETGVTVTWAIRTSGDDGNGFIAPSPEQVTVIAEAMAYFGGVSGLNPTQVNPGGTSNSATMLFGAYSNSGDGAGAYAYYPGSTSSTADAGDVWLNNGGGIATSGITYGSFTAFAILHEIGHAVGLAHPGGYNAGPGISITYANNAEFIEDTHQYTVMSYFDESNTTSSFGSYPDGLMLYDILALHQLYGADTSYHSGNTVYGFNATVGGFYDFTTNSDPVFAIWDGSGTDTLDVSGFSQAQTIDLREGGFSSIGGLMNNISIAFGAVIENAIGGSGDDSFIANDVANAFTGNGGSNTVSYQGTGQAVIARLDGGANLLGAAGDTFAGIDNLIGSNQGDGLIGDNDANRLEGGGGNDTLSGRSGDDTLLGGAGDDLLLGGGGADSMVGGDGTDTVSYFNLTGGVLARLDGGTNSSGALGDTISGIENLTGTEYTDALVGDGQANVLDGLGGNDTLFGGGGDDTLLGGEGTNHHYGQGGADTVSYDGVTGGVGIRLDTGAHYGAAAGDIINSIENVIGSAQNDAIVGNGLANRLDGGGGNDTLSGGDGDDTLLGGADDDVLQGGAGADSMDGGDGTDTTDYQSSATGVLARLDGGTNGSGAAGDMFTDIENLIGSGSTDALVGDAGANMLDGIGGDDTLYGGYGADTLIGGAGNDLIWGQGLSDVFVFADGFGTDVISDFDALDDNEKIDLSGVSAITSFADLTNPGNPHMTQAGANVVIDDFAGNTITLNNVTLGDLDTNDFTF